MEKEDVLIDIVENAVNDAMFAHKHNFKMYEYLIHNNLTKREIVDFLDCGTAKNIRITLEDLDLIIEGGHSFIREAYPNWTKSEARKIRKYLNKILSDAEKYKDKKSRRVRSK
jgi:hypothetical protein|tara:strand:+ start:125 stop:463 length:339 start_codon:yes stop_codon:yes gene_type:complete